VGEAGVTEDIPLFFTWIPILALLSNYDQEICLIHVGTEGNASIAAREGGTDGVAVRFGWTDF